MDYPTDETYKIIRMSIGLSIILPILICGIVARSTKSLKLRVSINRIHTRIMILYIFHVEGVFLLPLVNGPVNTKLLIGIVVSSIMLLALVIYLCIDMKRRLCPSCGNYSLYNTNFFITGYMSVCTLCGFGRPSRKKFVDKRNNSITRIE